MKCPLLREQYREVKGEEVCEWADCLKEECAWWQPELGNCIIYQLGMEIGTLGLFLEKIKDKMPHEEQFRK